MTQHKHPTQYYIKQIKHEIDLPQTQYARIGHQIDQKQNSPIVKISYYIFYRAVDRYSYNIIIETMEQTFKILIRQDHKMSVYPLTKSKEDAHTIYINKVLAFTKAI